jgi:hypothetical protein
MNLANPAYFCHAIRANFNRVAINLINRFDAIHIARMFEAMLHVE